MRATVFSIITLGICLAVAWPLIVRNMKVRGYLNTDEANLYPGDCKLIPGIENGSEDFELLPSGKLLVTSGVRWNPGVLQPPDYRGKILLLDLNQAELKPVQVTIKTDTIDLARFAPLGITAWVDKKTGKITVFIVNVIGSPQETVVEKFTYSTTDNTLYHVETIGMGAPNFWVVDDLVAVNDKQFYYTNIFGPHMTWEMDYYLALASVGFYDGEKTSLVDDGLGGPNGINVSPDGKYVYANILFDHYMRSYKRNEDNSLEKVEDYYFPAAVDNIMVEKNGDLWNVGHGSVVQIFSHMDNTSLLSPTKAYKLTMKEGRVTSSTTVFIDDGELFSGGSVGIPYKNRIIFGSVVNKAAVCDINKDA